MKGKKLLGLLLSLAMVIAMLTACGGGTSSEAPAAAPADASNIKVAVLLSGSANDNGWSQMAADAAIAAEEELGCQCDFSESLQTTDFESVMRGYADNGYNLIVAHGGEFLETSKMVATDYPDVKFLNSSAAEGNDKNLTGIQFGNYQLGFLNGLCLGYASENGKIGVIGAMESDAYAEWVEGIEAGAEIAHPGAECTVVFTGSFDDQTKAKQSATSLIEQGCDVLVCNCDAGSVGAVQEAEEKDIPFVGSVSDQTKDGATCFVSVIQDAGVGITQYIVKAIEGTIEPGAQVAGADVGVIYMTDYAGKYADLLTADEKAIVAEALQLFIDGGSNEDVTAAIAAK